MSRDCTDAFGWTEAECRSQRPAQALESPQHGVVSPRIVIELQELVTSPLIGVVQRQDSLQRLSANGSVTVSRESARGFNLQGEMPLLELMAKHLSQARHVDIWGPLTLAQTERMKQDRGVQFGQRNRTGRILYLPRIAIHTRVQAYAALIQQNPVVRPSNRSEQFARQVHRVMQPVARRVVVVSRPEGGRQLVTIPTGARSCQKRQKAPDLGSCFLSKHSPRGSLL